MAVLGRVVFRIIFNPEVDGGDVAITLPRVYLSLGFGPEVPMFGQISWSALEHAFWDGLRLAALMIAVIVLTLLIDIRKALTSAPKFLQNFSLVVGSALTFLPLLAENISRIRSGAKIRRNRRGSIVTPILESAVERSLALAASMELRGFGAPLIEPAADRVKLSNVSLNMGERKLLVDVSFEYLPGEVILLTGATGSGKTIFLQTLCGLAPAFTGGRLLGNRIGARTAFVNQRPELSFASELVADEIGFALKQMALSNQEIQSRVNELAEMVGIGNLLQRNLNALSAGQQQRVAIAAALASGAKTLLLDEPSSALDSEGLETLWTLIDSLSAAGTAVIIAEHHLERFVDRASRVLQIEDGRLNELTREQAETLADRKLKTLAQTPGDRLILFGANGSGKSTELRRLWESIPSSACVPQQASDLLLATTVRKEINSENGSKLLARLAPEIEPETHPHDLSAGQQLALALAIQLADDATTILLDEPTRGLDFETKSTLIEILGSLSADGHRLVVATNDQQFAEAIATQIRQLTKVDHA